MLMLERTGQTSIFWVLLVACIAWLSGCAGEPPSPEPSAISPSAARASIERSLPANARDPAGWSADIYAGFSVQAITPSHENICAVVAEIDQESSFRIDPVVPNLGVIARREIDQRAGQAGLPLIIVQTALRLNSSNGKSYGERIDGARTEKELSDIFEDFIGSVPMGRRLFSDRNPVRTRGPMQVNIAFAEQYAVARPYPYPVKRSIADEVFTRRGSVYFGTAHLLAYTAPYDRYIYRFADYNAGQYASRNAAFQNALRSVSGIELARDGALLSHDPAAKGAGSTELAVRAVAARLNLDDGEIHAALEQYRTREFEQTKLYQRVFAWADRTERRRLPRAMIPQIQLHGPKINRNLTTDWYAHRVDERYRRCLVK
jgi:Protein of unknown function (DUF1615)